MEFEHLTVEEAKALKKGKDHVKATSNALKELPSIFKEDKPYEVKDVYITKSGVWVGIEIDGKVSEVDHRWLKKYST